MMSVNVTLPYAGSNKGPHSVAAIDNSQMYNGNTVKNDIFHEKWKSMCVPKYKPLPCAKCLILLLSKIKAQRKMCRFTYIVMLFIKPIVS